MKVKVMKVFRDKNTKEIYEKGKVLTISKDRKAEIDAVDSTFVEEVEQEKKVVKKKEKIAPVQS